MTDERKWRRRLAERAHRLSRFVRLRGPDIIAERELGMVIEAAGRVGLVPRDQFLRHVVVNPAPLILGVIEEYGYIDGTHHKQWVLDQIARICLGDQYEEWAKSDDPEEYDDWDPGTAP